MPKNNADMSADDTTDDATEPSLQAENASLRDRMLRALADAENTRRRSEQNVKDAQQYAVSDFARELLTVADNLHRAIAAIEHHQPESVEDAALIEGVRATQRGLEQVFDRFGVRRIEALDQPFDPMLHEAVMEIGDPSREPGTVARVIEDGYTLHDRLLRPARVAVTKRQPEPADAHAPARNGGPD